MPAGLIDARRLLGWRLGRSAMPACCAGARRLPDSLMRDARSRAVAAVTASVAPFGCVRMRAGGPGPVRGSSRSGQQDQASDDRRVQATEAGEQPRFESNQGRSRPRPRRSRLMVADVQPTNAQEDDDNVRFPERPSVAYGHLGFGGVGWLCYVPHALTHAGPPDRRQPSDSCDPCVGVRGLCGNRGCLRCCPSAAERVVHLPELIAVATK